MAAGRVEKIGQHMFIVRSSDGTRTYRVYVDPGQGAAYSDDNGTRLRGYIGYPIIAALMVEGVLPYDEEVGEALRDIPWRRLNETLRRYALVEKEAKRVAAERGVPPARLEEYTRRVMEQLRRLRLRLLPQPPLELLSAKGGQGGGNEG